MNFCQTQDNLKGLSCKTAASVASSGFTFFRSELASLEPLQIPPLNLGHPPPPPLQEQGVGPATHLQGLQGLLKQV